MISLCVLALNEEEHLGGLLEICRPYVDEIVVWVDDRSTDETEAIAREHAEVVHVGTLNMDFSAARNWCIDHASGDWILSLDPDERPMPELLRWFHDMSRVADACLSLHENRIDGELVEGHETEYHCRFFRRKYRWTGKIHEMVELGNAKVFVAPLDLRIHHFKTSERQAMQNLRYLEWEEQHIALFGSA
ncbi:MAG: glycosyltransferase [Dehalococcoidia bacterium]|jgi:glycosyltransferase involved in cell wall biosynthesis